MNAVEIMAVVAATERHLLRLQKHLLDMQAAVQQSQARIEESRRALVRLQTEPGDAHEVAAKAPRVRPESWPCGIRIPDGDRPAGGLSARERQKLADRLAASLRAIGLACEVIDPDAFPARNEASGQPC
jgi:thioesterase domain-containing protein